MTAFLDILLERVPHALTAILRVAFFFSLFAVFLPSLTPRVFHAIESVFSRLAERKTLAIGVLFFSVIAIRLALLPLLPIPVPGIHDEFSYLLMADTFAHGRLANPPHPLWMSFESFHVNWFPTYSSKYPPGQGVVLAIGQLLGHPWIGVLLSVATMCAAILWMLQAWLPARWAFLGAALVALKFGIASYWINSYWGGAVAATGGALVLGAMPRIVRRSRTRDALVLGLGIAILANSRPYEGLLLSIPVAGWFLWWLAGKTKSNATLRTRNVRVFAPLAVVLLLTVGFMGYYNWRLTGKTLLFPHTLNTRTYRTTGLFLWDHPKEPIQYNNLLASLAWTAFRFFRSQDEFADSDLSAGDGRIPGIDLVDAALRRGADVCDFSAVGPGHAPPAHDSSRRAPARPRALLGRRFSACNGRWFQCAAPCLRSFGMDLRGRS